jgi:PTS system ascorbate-specific IIB component
MVTIMTICGMGLGTGLLAKMSVDRVLRRNGIRDNEYDIEVSDVGSVKRQGVDIYVTTSEFAPNVNSWAKNLVLVKNLFDEKEMEQALMPVFTRILKENE